MVEKLTKDTGTLKQNRKHFSPEVWCTIKALYATGQFSSLVKLHQHCIKIMTLSPSLDSIRKKCMYEGWSKLEEIGRIEENKKKNYAELFAVLGMDQIERAKFLIRGALVADKTHQAIIDETARNGPKSKTLQKLRRQYSRELIIAHKYLHTINELCGNYPQERTVT